MSPDPLDPEFFLRKALYMAFVLYVGIAQLQSDKKIKKDMPGWWKRYLPAVTIAVSEKRRDER